ncbi:MAG: hypothetical protein H6838_12095 [Planctomycetes bacterium]|nr:hypothetical protein [Planctomycetota bacterium]MCB9886229.1 hypothetical protein [Planctomycetota bacterium]
MNPVSLCLSRAASRAAYCLLPLGAALCAHAQQLPEGYTSYLGRLQASAGNLLRIANGRQASFDGQDLVAESSTGVTTLLHFAAPVFGSFTIATGGPSLLFGESSSGGLWLVPLSATPPTQPLATLPLNYDAAMYRPGLAVVSAKAGGWSSPDNDLWVVDLQSGALQLLAQFPGASGPVAVSADGDIYYATASQLFPSPPGTCSVLRLRRAVVDQALQQNQVLGTAQADLMWTGLDAASDLAFDDDGDLFFVDWWNNRVGELNDVASATPWVSTWIDYGTATFGATALQFVRGNGRDSFEPFQPASGRLLVHETSYGTISQVRELRSSRPELRVSVPNPVPAGAFALQVTGGPRQGLGLAALAVDGPSTSLALTIPGFEARLLWESRLSTALGTYVVSLDAQGRATLNLANPGTQTPLPLLAQFACIDPAAGNLGSTEAVRFDLGW